MFSIAACQAARVRCYLQCLEQGYDPCLQEAVTGFHPVRVWFRVEGLGFRVLGF